MRRLQQAGLLEVEIEHGDEADAAVYLRVARAGDVVETYRGDVEQFRTDLGLPADFDRFLIAESGAELDGALAVRGRSILGILHALSHAVEVPAEHRSAGFVTQSRPARDGEASWRALLGGLFAVQTASSEPPGAFVAVEYRGHWFYIPDDDLNAKASFSLVGHLIALQSDAAAGEGNSLLLIGN
jgi:hypothetical protein